jgi:hypothetical protein
LAAHVSHELAQSLGRDVLGAFAIKWNTPAVAPEGDLVFGEKVELPFDLFRQQNFTFVQPTGALDMRNEKKLGNPLRVEAT